MSWQPESSIEQDWPRFTRVVRALIAANVVIAFLAATIIRPDELVGALAFRSGPLASTWWTAFTYMFLHAGLMHLAMNMYSLYLFGPRLEHAWGARSFTLFYVWCGLGGAIFHALFGGLVPMVGASAAIFGVMLAYAMHWPRDEILMFGVFPIRVATLVLIMGALNLLWGLQSPGSGVAYFAHLGGFAFGFLYLKKPQHVSIDQLRQRVSAAPDVSDDMTPRASPKPATRQRPRDEVDEVVARSKAVASRRPARVATAKKQTGRDTRGEELDRVLDKISKHGLDSLTPGEKKLLEEMSRELRDQ